MLIGTALASRAGTSGKPFEAAFSRPSRQSCSKHCRLHENLKAMLMIAMLWDMFPC
ncbi:hypothetical protein [Limihaloglobus sulfuriphilus]|uniref:hypothetical protein n=1 Tax=Limihaloglobus sulfuriphilus TaxID=1851148 RepID=UPI001649D76B|nr:hypothetical protein [Limihaloglobus sulfuriphilus]